MADRRRKLTEDELEVQLQVVPARDHKSFEKAISDNTNLFCNVTKTIEAIPLSCDAHGAGMFCLSAALSSELHILVYCWRSYKYSIQPLASHSSQVLYQGQ